MWFVFSLRITPCFFEKCHKADDFKIMLWIQCGLYFLEEIPPPYFFEKCRTAHDSKLFSELYYEFSAACLFAKSSRFSRFKSRWSLRDYSRFFGWSQHHYVSFTVRFVSCYISRQGYYISMQLIGWSFCYISSRVLLHFYAAFLLHFYASFITFLCRYYISMQGCYISMQVITFLAFITFLCPTKYTIK